MLSKTEKYSTDLAALLIIKSKIVRTSGEKTQAGDVHSSRVHEVVPLSQNNMDSTGNINVHAGRAPHATKSERCDLDDELAHVEKGDLGTASTGQQVEGMDNYTPTVSEEWDDLETFDEQLQQEAKDSVDVKSELRNLQEEAEMPLEELLKMYGRAEAAGHDVAQPVKTSVRRARSYVPDEPREDKVESPFILRHELRDYQKFGLKWLLGCHSTGVNGILADEMGLGKTIQTISLLAYLACEHGLWGPHLIVVPTSVMVNWEVEFKKWCPALKILTYFGNQKERKAKRTGWSKPNSFHVCITTYRLVVQDQNIFRRKHWEYLILDEAHMIKNWRSQRWQTLLSFESSHRLLITGTPLQNDVMELWALLHFLMPDLFQSHSEFKSWFSNPLLGMAEGRIAVDYELTSRLHAVLRPFILRRLKVDVEQSLPSKVEHVVRCRLSRRQKRLYDEYMSSHDTIKALSSSNVMGVMNCLMQLRKVCNHPDLFAGRSIISAFDMPSELLVSCPRTCLDVLALDRGMLRHCRGTVHVQERERCIKPVEHRSSSASECLIQSLMHIRNRHYQRESGYETFAGYEVFDALASARANRLYIHDLGYESLRIRGLTTVASSIQASRLDEVLKFLFRIPKARARTPQSSSIDHLSQENAVFLHELLAPLRRLIIRSHVVFPDARLVQFDCGKLQALATLLRTLKSGGHKVVIFTQMTKVLDILERFLNLYSYSYVRLDGTTKPEQRQILMQRFNADRKIFAFILSTRSGGFGINLTGADTVIFYDSDWNPAVDAQAQDRCHRIGQTREVNIYRLISEDTIEENIFKKALQKRELDELAIQRGRFNLSSFDGSGDLMSVLLFVFESFGSQEENVNLEKYGK